jgi:peroxiredoxin
MTVSRSSVLGRWMRALVAALLLGAWPACNSHVGPPPGAELAKLDFVLKDAKGSDVRLTDYRGKPMLVNFWATWCNPCKAEIPWFTEFAAKYKSRGLAVVGISVDDPADDINKFASDLKVNYPLLMGAGHEDILQAYDAGDLIPVSWLIKRDGSVLVKVKGIHEKAWFEQQIETLLAAS